MTTWVENPSGGRDRGLRGIVRAWAEVLGRPRRFFRHGVAPGDQAPGLVFAVAMAVMYAVALALLDPARFPTTGPLRAAITILLAGILVAPAVLHLLAALQTLLLMVVVRDRAGVSETVQVIAYATAPGPLAAIPLPEIRVACCLYGAVLLVGGLGVVHDTTRLRALVAGAVPAILLFGVGFDGIDALVDLLLSWYII